VTSRIFLCGHYQSHIAVSSFFVSTNGAYSEPVVGTFGEINLKLDIFDSRKRKTASEKTKTASEKPLTGSRKVKTGSRKVKTCSRKMKTGSEKVKTGPGKIKPTHKK
jgi:hypothetical protein